MCNAVGDMVSGLYVGLLIDAGYTTLAFGIAASPGAVGVGWMLWLMRRKKWYNEVYQQRFPFIHGK